MGGAGPRLSGHIPAAATGNIRTEIFPHCPKKEVSVGPLPGCLCLLSPGTLLFWRSPNTGMLSQPSGTPSPSHLLCFGTLPCSSAPPQPQVAQEGICSAPYLLPSSCSAHLHPRGHPKGNGAKHPATGNGPDPATPKGFTCSCLCCSLCSLPTEAQQQHCLCSW